MNTFAVSENMMLNNRLRGAVVREGCKMAGAFLTGTCLAGRSLACVRTAAASAVTLVVYL